MSLTDSKQIKFPKKSYVGVIGRKDDNMTLGFMTEDGTDKAAEKRKGTVDDWVRNNSRREGSVASARSMDNAPMIGFRLGREVRRHSGWGSGNVKWRIEDPRGFELEISSPNMAQIVDSCVIDQGEILEECIWARLKGDNILVPVSSELYQTAHANSERQGKSVKPSECERGDYVVLQNGTEGVYLGKFQSFDTNYDRASNTRPMFDYKWKAKPVHVLITKQTGYDNVEREKVHTVATFKPAYLTKREEGPMSPEDAEALLWQVNLAQSYSRDYLFLTQSAMEFERIPTTLTKAMDKQNDDERFGNLVVERGTALHRIHVVEWTYEEWKKVKAGLAQPRSNGPYGSSRYAARITRVSQDGKGVYLVHHDSASAYGRDPQIELDDLAPLPLFWVRATIKTSDGAKRVIR